jgi:hypothetical protein
LNESGHLQVASIADRRLAQIAPAKLIPLKDAPWAFASKRLRSERLRAREALSSPKTSKLDSASPEMLKQLASENPAEAFKLAAKDVGDKVHDLLEGMSIRSAPELAMRASLLEKLRDEKLEAWGVQSTPKQERQLEMLESHFFVDAKIDWNRNRVTNFGVTYSAVGVRRPIASATTPERHNETPSPSKVRGRPSKTPEIERAIELLLNKGVDLAKLPRPKAYEAVRKCAASELNSDTAIGFTDPVIQRSLFSRFGPRR